MDKKEQFHFSAMGSSYSLTDSSEFAKRGSDFIWYGADNLFPQHTIDLYQNSATHNALVNSISSWIYGGGIDANNKERHPEDWVTFNQLINKKIGKNDIQLMCMDLKLNGGFYISFTYSLDRTKVVEMEVLPFETMRSGQANEDGEVEWYYHSNDWSAGSRAKYTELKAYDPKAKSVYPTQVLCVKMNSVGSYYYPKPDYIGAWNYIELDKNVSQFHLSQIEKGLAPSFIINFANGIPPREKREEIKRTIESELAGSTNAGKFLCTFSDGRDTTPEITPVPLSDADKQYQFLSEEITKKVMISHRVVSPRLFGVMDSGGLGNNAEELQIASALFEQTVVDPFRDVIIDALKVLLGESSINLDLFFKPFDLFKTEFADTEAETINEEVATEVIPTMTGDHIEPTLDLIAKVKEGTLTQEQAIVFMNQFLKFPMDIAHGFFSETPVATFQELSSKKKDERPHLNDDQAEFFLNKLQECADLNDDESWELIVEEKIDTSKKNFHKFAKPNKMPSKSMADPDAKSKEGDVGMYKVRYSYQRTNNVPNESGNKSRKFCDIMMNWSDQGLEWTYEDINDMSKSKINGSFAEKGQTSYDLFLYKGGCYCRHGWIRRIYFRKRDVSGRFMPSEGMKNEVRVGDNPFVRQKGSESIAPYDLPKYGKLNPPFKK
tara:strand:+ start:2807 stop:4798 length:1992 start_codon:yes stop_codon:yes gene_type:complete